MSEEKGFSQRIFPSLFLLGRKGRRKLFNVRWLLQFMSFQIVQKFWLCNNASAEIKTKSAEVVLWSPW